MYRFFVLVFFILLFSCKSKNIRNSPPVLLQNPIKVSVPQRLRTFYDYSLKIKKIQGVDIKANKKPHIIFIFIDTLRRDYAEKYASNLNVFMKNNTTPEHTYSEGTATWYSVPSFFHSIPAFLVYPFFDEINGKNQGALSLLLLEKLGYSFSMVGKDWRCPELPLFRKEGWSKWVEFVFSKNAHLVRRCKDKNFYFNLEDGYKDDVATDHMMDTIQSLDISKPQFMFFSYYGTHDNYAWPKIDFPIMPSKNNVHYRGLDSFEMIRNSYANAVQGVDLLANKVLQSLKEKGIYDESIIFIISDHGEKLGEYGELFHGGRPLRESTNNVISFKLGKEKKKKIQFMSLMDIFPTVFDFMGINSKHFSYFFGKSVLKDSSQHSAVVSKSSGELPTREMVLINQDYKFWINVKEKDFFSSKSFYIVAITDLFDRDISKRETFSPCLQKRQKECLDFMRKEFPDAIKSLYGEW